MSLPGLLKKFAKGESVSLTGVWDSHLISRRLAEEREHVRGKYHPSNLSSGVCRRAVVYQQLNTVTSNPHDVRTLRIFHLGDAVHEMIQRELKEAGVLEQAEVPIKNDEYGIVGHCDAILNLGGKKWLGEFKTINSHQFRGLTSPKPEHVEQVSLYMFCTGIHDAIVLYFCKDTSEIKEFKVKYEQSRVDELLLIIKEVERAIAGRKLPTRAAVAITESPCRYCAMADKCWGEDPEPEWPVKSIWRNANVSARRGSSEGNSAQRNK